MAVITHLWVWAPTDLAVAHIHTVGQTVAQWHTRWHTQWHTGWHSGSHMLLLTRTDTANKFFPVFMNGKHPFQGSAVKLM